MVDAEDHVHDRPDGDHVAIRSRDDDGALRDRLHRDDPDLGDVQDRHHEVRAEVARVVDRERPAAEIIDAQLAGLCPSRDVGDRQVQAVDRELVRIANDRNDQAVVKRDSDTDVHPALGHQTLVGPNGIECRGLLERGGDGLDDERDEAEPDPLLRLVIALGLLAERDEAGRIDLHLDVGMRRLERARHLRCDPLAHLGERHEYLVGARGKLDPGRGLDRGAGAGRPRGGWSRG